MFRECIFSINVNIDYLKATITDFVPVILTWLCIIITVSVDSYNTYNDYITHTMIKCLPFP